MTAYDEAAEIYEMGGLFPIPIMGKDVPVGGATGYDGTVTPEKIMQWLHPDPKVRANAGRGNVMGNVALRHWLTLAIDVDHGYGVKNGLVQLAQYAETMGLSPLPATWSSTARGDDSPSRQFIYQIDDNFRAKTKPCKSVELCNWHHRFTACAPTIHPDIGQPYAWYLPGEPGVPPSWGARTTRYPRRSDFAPLPADWVAAFRGAAANADRSVVTVALPELLDTFTRGEPDGVVQKLLDKWGSEDEHVGHDEAKQSLIHAFLLGREGHVGVHQLVELIVSRLKAYLEDDRPDKAQFEMYGDDNAPGLIQACADIAQQKPINKIAVVYLKRGESPTPQQFMQGVQVEYVDDDSADAGKVSPPEEWKAFLGTFKSRGSRRQAENRELWLFEALQRSSEATAISVWMNHARNAFIEVVEGRYSAWTAATFLEDQCPSPHVDHCLRVALATALVSLEEAAA